MCADPRSPVWRRRDTERRLTHDADVWVSSASPDGTPCLVPLSFDWDGRSLLLATSADSPTGERGKTSRPPVTVHFGVWAGRRPVSCGAPAPPSTSASV